MAGPSGASSSRSSSSTSFTPPPRLAADLAKLRDPAHVSDELWNDTTEAAVLWLLSLHPAYVGGLDGNGSGGGTSSKGKERAVDDDGVATDRDLVHWFCGAKGAKGCWEPATFCIRLLGMKKQGEVATWREKFDRLTSTCPACAGAFQISKVEFRERYLRHYKPEQSIHNFIKGVSNIERANVLAAFAAAGFDTPPVSPPPDSHFHPAHTALLANAPLASLQTILVNQPMFEDEDLLEMILAGLPVTAPLPLPRSPSPGLLALRLHHSHLLRNFAEIQLARCTKQPMPDEYRARGLGHVLDSHLGVLASRDRGEVDAATGIRLHYTDQRKDFMEGLASCLSVLSAEAIRQNLVRRSTSLSASLDVVHLVASHLGDSGDHLEGVLAGLKILLDRLGAHFWSVGDEKYEEVVLHAILDNPDFHEAFETNPLVAAATSSSSGPLDSPWLDWLPPFLRSVAHSPTLFTNSLALVASTFLDRLQQSRFGVPARTRALQIALALFSEIFLGTAPSSASSTPATNDDIIVASAPTYPHAAAASKVLDLHAATLANFAFSATFAAPEWSKAAEEARTFVLGVAKRDGKAIARAVYGLAVFSQQYLERDRQEKKRLQRVAAGDAKAKQEPEAPPVTAPSSVAYTKALWDNAYATVREQDLKAVVILLQLVAPTAQFEKLTSQTWQVKEHIRTQMKAVNDALATVRDPIVELLINVADERVDHLIEFMGQPGVVHQLLALLLSPVEAVHNTAQGLIKQAFDVTTRRDVFRQLMAHWPEATLRGLASAIQTFQKSATTLPEACGIAKRLVRCLSDVLDVLCAKTDGLLRDPEFIRRGRDFKLQAKLLALWDLMGGALALLFRRTPDWAVFFENEAMTEWMRDAILFGADMLEQIRILEVVIAGQSLDRSASGMLESGSPSKDGSISSASKESTTAERMIGALNAPLEDLVAWLRLNDEDLLLHTYNLVMRMLGRFTRSGIALRDTVAARLKKFADKPPGDVPRERRSTILREDQLLEIREALEDNEDAVKRRKRGGAVEVLELSDEDSTKSGKSSSSVRLKSSVTTSAGPSQSKLPFPSSSSSASRPSAAAAKARPAVPVAARPRGVPWTTYSSKKAEEESESESSEEEDVVRDANGKRLKGLALLAKDQKPSIRKVEPKRRAVIINGLSGEPVQNGARGRGIGQPKTKEDMQALRAARLRSAQDFSRLHRAILQWNPTDDADVPPNATLPSRLPSEFKSPQDYFAAFEPLLLTECWEQVRQAKLEAVKEGQVILADIAGRQSVDDFVDVFCTVEHGQLRDRFFFGDSDLVWLRQGQRQIFAKIQTVNRRREHVELTLRCHLGNDAHNAGPGLGARTKWELLKLANLSTVHREYAALQALEWVDLCPDILNPRPPAAIPTDSRTIQRAMAAYKVNEPQAMAIHGALRTQGFSLIQGPPGTGKTSTIVGLVGAFVDSRPRVAVPIVAGKAAPPSDPAPVAKILLCAPSNAAVDEVAKRLKDGVRLLDGSLYVPKVVRIGADSAIDISVKDVFIDELVERAMSGGKATIGSNNDAQAKMQAMRSEIDSLRGERDLKKMEMDAVVSNDYRRGELNLELKKIKSRIFELSQLLDSEKDKAQQSRRAMDAEQRKMRLKILSEADVICSTLSGAGHDYMAQLPFDFETVIIDEAAQSIELSSLIPLKYGCTRCILVGDPLQLPPTVISGTAARGGYDRSLFVRVMQRGPQAVHLLSIQYRMHPNISAFPSAAFYQSRLTDGPNMEIKTLQPWHANALFPPYAFYHVDGREVAGRHHSWTNPTEAATTLAIYERLKREYASIDFDYRIGIVTPYKGQVQELRRTFRQRYGEEILSKIAFNTVDGFQGQEKDIIILSCVRGGSTDKGVGFLADTRRMNVALTRARSSIWILGDSNKLRSNQYWGNLVGDAETRGLFRKADANTFRSSYSAPPVIRSAVVKSHARAIEMSPAYSSDGPGQPNKLIAPTPPHLVPGTPNGRGVPPSLSSSALKKRLNEQMDVGSPGKKPKLENGGEQGETKPAVGGMMSGARRPPPRPVGVASPAPSSAPAVKKAAPSLFVPAKRKPPPKK